MLADGAIMPGSPGFSHSSEEIEAFYESAPCGYVTMRADGTILRANRTLRGWIGQGCAGPWRELHLQQVLTPASWVIFSLKCAPVLAMHGRIAEVALDLRCPDRPPKPVLASFQAADRGADGSDTLIRGILFDATERRCYERDLLAARKAAEKARILSEQAGARLAAILQSTSDGVLFVDPDWRISFANLVAERLLGGDPVGADLRLAFPHDRGGLVSGAFRHAMEDRATEAVQAPVEACRWLWVRACPAPGGGMAVFFRDTTQERLAAAERERHAREIERLATHDALTGLPNRRLFVAKLRDAIAAGEGGVTVLCLDLDRFKQVNDTLGHPAGDALLQAVAGRLRQTLGSRDVVARFGGDEFAVLLGGDASGDASRREARATAVANRIGRRLSEAYTLNGQRAEIGTSIGIAVSAGAEAEPETLLAQADLALYEAKRAGRGRHAVFHPAMMQAHRSRVELGDALRQGLARNELVLHYQPVVGVIDRKVRGHEALVRWDRPGHGLMPPASFIPIAEELGLIDRIGAFVLRRACVDAAAWPDRRLRVAVNVSPHQFRDPGLVDAIAGALDESGLSPGRLELEVTEGALLEHQDEVLSIMHRLRGLGISFALDDFGTGFSSLAYLRSFPFDRVKIDRSFLREAESSERDRTIVESVASLCRRLGMTCLAEGVESERQFALLAEVGCDEAQGYLFGSPVPQQGVCRSKVAELS